MRARNAAQDRYLAALRKHELVFAEGPAGTGKTWLAVGHAVSLLEQGVVERLILSRPAVEAGERLGFLPGDMKDKVDPYLRPIYDALYDFMDGRMVERGIQTGMIEIAPLAFMRGRTLSKAAILLDEAQNATAMQMKMFLTRLGEGSRMMVNGDPTQTDLAPGQKSGLERSDRAARAGSNASATCASATATSSATTSCARSSKPTRAAQVDRARTGRRRDDAKGRIRRDLAALARRACRRGRWRAQAIAVARRAKAASRLRPGAELCVHLADDAHIRALNARWRGLDEPTNVLVLSRRRRRLRSAKARLLGDIVLAFETVAREAADEGKPLADHYRHLVVHGFLHLIGFDHDNEADAERDGGDGNPHPRAARRRRSLSRRRSGGRSP